jgi:hypothetical protein
MPEHFTRNTESVHAWCHHCGKLTDHAVSDGRIGRCINDHSSPKPPRANIPAFNVDELDTDTIEVRPGNLAQGKAQLSMTDRLHIQALDGWQYPRRKRE